MTSTQRYARLAMRDRLTFANVMSCIAVFLALGGSALALRANSVGSRAVKNESLKGRDIKNESLKGADLETSAVGSREIDEASFDLEPFVKLGSKSSGCNPNTATPVSCGSVVLGLTEPSRALITAAGTQDGQAAAAKGQCHLSAPGEPNMADAQIGDPEARAISEGNGFALTATTNPAQLLPPGPNTFRILCNETGGDVAFSTTLSVVALGGTAG